MLIVEGGVQIVEGGVWMVGALESDSATDSRSSLLIAIYDEKRPKRMARTKAKLPDF